MTVVQDTFFKHVLLRTSDFFGDDKKYKSFKDDTDPKNYPYITDVQIDCIGYGYFEPDKVLNRFTQYVVHLLRNCPAIKNFKIVLNGFDIQRSKVMQALAKTLLKIKNSIKVLWIHTSHLSSCRISDFRYILFLLSSLGNLNLQQVSLQFSFWKFSKGPLSFQQLQTIFTDLMKENQGIMSHMENRKFRLQMSGWYYKEWEAKRLLGFALSDQELDELGDSMKPEYADGFQYEDEAKNQLVSEFHKKINQLMNGLLHAMKNVRDFQIDFRNWNQLIKMKELKKILDNLTKENTYQKSLVSKIQQFMDQDDQTALRTMFVI